MITHGFQREGWIRPCKLILMEDIKNATLNTSFTNREGKVHCLCSNWAPKIRMLFLRRIHALPLALRGWQGNVDVERSLPLFKLGSIASTN